MLDAWLLSSQVAKAYPDQSSGHSIKRRANLAAAVARLDDRRVAPSAPAFVHFIYVPVWF